MKRKGMLKLTQYVKEFLTTTQDAIFFETRRATKSGLLGDTWTSEGQVFRVQKDDARGSRINDLNLI